MLKICISILTVLALCKIAIGVAIDVRTKSLPDKIHATQLLKKPSEEPSDRRNHLAAPIEERNKQFWIDLAYSEVLERVKYQSLNLNKAKNLIMFMGDGMSLNTVTAARIHKGQRAGNPGEESHIGFQQFPYVGLSKTYCTDAQVPDSACSATAYLCGVKTNIVNVGVTANVLHNNCTASMDPSNHVSSIAAWAQAAGKSTGFITTTTLTHASPSGAYAHVANRFWESDTDILEHGDPGTDPNDCMDIAQQLVTQEPGRNFDVVMGGGMGKFVPKTLIDLHGNAGERSDGKNLLSSWQSLHPRGVILTNRDQLLNVNVSDVSNIMGLFHSTLMNFHYLATYTDEPTLAEMTKVTLEMLQKNKNGYFVFIEGGLIDIANHYNIPGLSTDETLEMDKAIQVAREMTNEEDTLIVVTADHAHPLSISGFPRRGNDILGLNEDQADKNNIKYTTLNYAAGPNQYISDDGIREDLTGRINDPFFVFPSQIPMKIGVHGGDDVGIFASGPYAHLFSGVLEESTIPHLMAYAACIGDGPKMCDE